MKINAKRIFFYKFTKINAKIFYIINKKENDDIGKN